jgi:lysophospholipase L1-like esterase
MLHGPLAFHNVDELESIPGLSGVRLQRLPAAIRARLGFKAHTRGRFYSERAAGCEIRFVAEGPFVRVTLSAVEAEATAFVFRGDFAHSRHHLKAGAATTLFLEDPPFFAQVEPSALRTRRFAPVVWRIAFNHDAIVHYHGVEAFAHALRAPRADELPARTWLAYGSSITFGGNAVLGSNSYVQHAAQRLGVDVLNLGLPGSCLCEASTAEYLAQRRDWNFATVELGVNLVDHATPEEFERRVRHLLATLAHAQPTRPIFVIDIFSNRADAARDGSTLSAQRTPIFREIVHREVASLGAAHVRLIPAKEILPDFSGLTSDLLHPSDEGHLAMGDRLAQRLAAELTP